MCFLSLSLAASRSGSNQISGYKNLANWIHTSKLFSALFVSYFTKYHQTNGICVLSYPYKSHRVTSLAFNIHRICCSILAFIANNNTTWDNNFSLAVPVRFYRNITYMMLVKLSPSIKPHS